MNSGTAEAQALANALIHQTDAVSKVIESGATLRASVRGQWIRRASTRAGLVDAAINSTRHRLGDAAPERACVDQWLDIVARDFVDDPSDNQLYDVRRILKECRPQAEALARVRLDARAYSNVHKQLEHLCTALNEHLDTWRLPLARLSPLAALPPRTWMGLAREPAWAVVYALGEACAPNDDYRDAIETLIKQAGQWAKPHIASAAKFARIDLADELDPTRIEPLLKSWPWPNAVPPLAIIAALADTDRTSLSCDQWAATLALDLDGELALLSPEGLVELIESTAREFRAEIEKSIVRIAHSRLENWCLERRKQPPFDAGHQREAVCAEAALMRMRTLWAENALLSPDNPGDDNLRIEPMAPDEPAANEESGWVIARSPPSLQYRVRNPRALVWRVPYTSPERAIAGIDDMSELATEIAENASFTISCRRGPHDIHILGSTPRPANGATARRREVAVKEILDRIVAECFP